MWGIRAGRFALFAIFLSLNWRNLAFADFNLHDWKNYHQPARRLTLSPSITRFSTGSNFDFQGTTVTPAGLSQVSRFGTSVAAAYGVSPIVTLFGRLSWSSVQVSRTSTSGSAYGLDDQSLGMSVRLWEAVFFQFRADLPLYSNVTAQTNGTPFLGDSSTDLTGGAFFTLPLWGPGLVGNWMLTAGVGYTWRSDGFSTALPGSIELRYRRQVRGWQGSLGFDGVQSLRSDTTQTRSTSGTAGSNYANAINPSFMNIRGKIGYQFDPQLALEAGYSKTLLGQNFPNSSNLFLGLVWNLDRSDAGDAGAKSPAQYGKPNKGFVSYGLEAKIVRVNDRLNLIKINKGTQDSVSNGQIFDIFIVKQDGSIGDAIARGKVAGVRSNESALQVIEYFKEVWIEEGFVAKRPLQ